MVTVTQKQGKDKEGALVLGLNQIQCRKMYKLIPKSAWFMSFGQKCGTFGIEMKMGLAETQAIVAKACG